MNQGFDSPYQSSLSLVGAGMQYSAFRGPYCWRVGGVGLTRLPTKQMLGFPGREFESLTFRLEGYTLKMLMEALVMTSAILRRRLGEDTRWIRFRLSEVANDDRSGLMDS